MMGRPAIGRRALFLLGAVALAATALGAAVLFVGPWIAVPGAGSLRWERGAPESVGIDGPRLRSLSRDLASRGAVAFLVLRHGTLVHERYALGRGPWRPQRAASLTKPLVGTLASLAAAESGWVNLDHPVADRIPSWRDDSLRSRITYRHLLTHTSGLPNGRGDTVETWAVPFWSQRPDLLQSTIEHAPVVGSPGESYAYSGPGYAVLSCALTASLPRETPDLRALFRRRILEPLGIPPRAWRMDLAGVYRWQGHDVYPAWSGTALAPRAALRIGELMLHQGRWNGRQVLDPALVAQATAPVLVPARERSRDEPVPTLGWWSNAMGTWPGAPPDAFVGAGNGGQILLVIPSLDLVAVRFGTGMADATFWESLRRDLVEPLMECVDAAGRGTAARDREGP